MAESVILKMCRERGIIPSVYASSAPAVGKNDTKIPASPQIEPAGSKKGPGHNESVKKLDEKPSVENESKTSVQEPSSEKPTKKCCGTDAVPVPAPEKPVECDAKTSPQEPPIEIEKPTKKICGTSVALAAPEKSVEIEAKTSVQEPSIEEPTKKVCGTDAVPEPVPAPEKSVECDAKTSPQEPPIEIEKPTKKICGTSVALADPEKPVEIESKTSVQELPIEKPTKKVCGTDAVPVPAPEKSVEIDAKKCVQEPPIEKPTKKVCGTDAVPAPEQPGEPAKETVEAQPVANPIKKICAHGSSTGNQGGSDGDDSTSGLGSGSADGGDDSENANSADDSASASGGGDEEFVLWTAPFDPRFPNTNQTKHCATAFIDFHRCTRLRGEDYEPCNYFKKVFTSICPNKWIEKWNEQIEAGTYPVKLDP